MTAPLEVGFSIFLFICGLMLGTVAHELGHFAAAKLVGIRILAIDIGTGSSYFASFFQAKDGCFFVSSP